MENTGEIFPENNSKIKTQPDKISLETKTAEVLDSSGQGHGKYSEYR